VLDIDKKYQETNRDQSHNQGIVSNEDILSDVEVTSERRFTPSCSIDEVYNEKANP